MVTRTNFDRMVNGRERGWCSEFTGLHTDQKPTNVAINSLFLELDTGDVYYFNGTTWAKVGG